METEEGEAEGHQPCTPGRRSINTWLVNWQGLACFSAPETEPIFFFSLFENAVSALDSNKAAEVTQKPPG